MGGFQNASLNRMYKEEAFNRIIGAIVKGCELMVSDCIKEGRLLDNHEEKIRTYLTENYLDNDEKRDAIGLQGINIRFEIEVPENYNPVTISHIGRTDIRIVSDDWFRNKHAYYIVECKRLDGGDLLNNLYVKEGVSRFVGDTPKYSSFYNKNIMLGFCVKRHGIKQNVVKIADILTRFVAEELSRLTICSDMGICTIYKNTYTKPQDLELRHVFYDMADIIA